MPGLIRASARGVVAGDCGLDLGVQRLLDCVDGLDLGVQRQGVDVRYGGLGRYLGLGVSKVSNLVDDAALYASVSGGPVNVVCWRTFARLWCPEAAGLGRS